MFRPQQSLSITDVVRLERLCHIGASQILMPDDGTSFRVRTCHLQIHRKVQVHPQVVPLVIPEKSKDFVRVLIGQNRIEWPLAFGIPPMSEPINDGINNLGWRWWVTLLGALVLMEIGGIATWRTARMIGQGLPPIAASLIA